MNSRTKIMSIGLILCSCGLLQGYESGVLTLELRNALEGYNALLLKIPNTVPVSAVAHDIGTTHSDMEQLLPDVYPVVYQQVLEQLRKSFIGDSMVLANRAVVRLYWYVTWLVVKVDTAWRLARSGKSPNKELKEAIQVFDEVQKYMSEILGTDYKDPLDVSNVKKVLRFFFENLVSKLRNLLYASKLIK